MVFGLSEAHIYEAFKTYHLLEFCILLFLLSVRHLARRAFDLVRSGIGCCFDLLTFIVQRWYKFRADIAESREAFKQGRQVSQVTRRKPLHPVQRLVLANDSSPSSPETPQPT